MVLQDGFLSTICWAGSALAPWVFRHIQVPSLRVIWGLQEPHKEKGDAQKIAQGSLWSRG